jgi:hypothetical protein
MAAQTKTKAPVNDVKRVFTISLVVFLIASAIFLALGGPTHIARLPGIFGTHANLFSDINLIAQIVLLAGLTVGYFLAHQGNITAHQYNQTAWVLFNIVLTIFIMIVAYYEYVLVPGEVSTLHGIVATIHAILGLLAILCGVYLLLRMNQLIPKRWRIRWWKKLMQLTLGLYLLVGVIGLGIYYVWYILGM